VVHTAIGGVGKRSKSQRVATEGHGE